MSRIESPNALAVAEIMHRESAFSPCLYRKFRTGNGTYVPVRSLLRTDEPYVVGDEPGSDSYVSGSTTRLLRTRCLQDEEFLLSARGDGVEEIAPNAFVDQHLRAYDILLSKDSNVGAVAMLPRGEWGQHMVSGGIAILKPDVDRFYLLAVLKHPSFKDQVDAVTPRGATIRHAKSLWLDCVLPIPKSGIASEAGRRISLLARKIVAGENAIRSTHHAIIARFADELRFTVVRQCSEIVNLGIVRDSLRFDTGLYNTGFRTFASLVDSYPGGSTSFARLGIVSRRGPNLAESVIGKVLYSDEPQKTWYELVRPVNMTEYGTLRRREWLGTQRSLATLKAGEVLLGCEGFEKGRTWIVPPDVGRCTTNFHATALSWPGAAPWRLAAFRCYLAFLRHAGVIDWVGVGGSGGHMSPEYFEYLPIPKFPDPFLQKIARSFDAASVGSKGVGIVQLQGRIDEAKAALTSLVDELWDGVGVS